MATEKASDHPTVKQRSVGRAADLRVPSPQAIPLCGHKEKPLFSKFGGGPL